MSDDTEHYRRTAQEIELHERLARIESGIGHIVTEFEGEKRARAERNVEVNQRFDGFDSRVHGIEKKIYMAMGAVSLVITVIEILKK